MNWSGPEPNREGLQKRAAGWAVGLGAWLGGANQGELAKRVRPKPTSLTAGIRKLPECKGGSFGIERAFECGR